MTAELVPTLLPALQASGFAGTWETDLATGIVYPSERFAHLLGLGIEHAARGMPLADLLGRVHAADRERVGALVHKAHETAGRFDAEFRTLGHGEAVRWVAARGQIETDALGRGLRCRGIALDVTDTRRGGSARADEMLQIMTEIADKVIAARRLADALPASVLRTTLDILLFELGRELAKDSVPPGRLH